MIIIIIIRQQNEMEKIFTKNAKCYDQWKMFISESFWTVFSQCLKKDSLYPLFDFLRSMFLLIKSSY